MNARGTDSGYYIFIRTTGTWFPWQYYSAEIKVDESWKNIDIPWTSFKIGDYGSFGRLNANKLKSIAIVAYGNDFDAQIDINEIGFY